jgi:glycosyltransferase involved in cell wall biosynthesis
MKIGIHSTVSGNIGGAESQIVALAQYLAQFSDVDILHHGNLEREKIAVFYDSPLDSSVNLHYVTSQRGGRDYSSDYAQAIDLDMRLTRPYDMFISFTHSIPLFNAAPRGILSVLFPFISVPDSHLQAWYQHISNYQNRVANSNFTSRWVKRRWGIDSQVIYPGVGTSFRIVKKHKTILSVGRFAVEGHSKKQLEMIEAFQKLKETILSDWNYICIGGLTESFEGEREYFHSARRLAAGCQARVMANVKQKEKKRLYEQSAVFWHASGYGIDEDLTPDLAEHFGIVTVEAMAAGCVPIVINRGGQPEIVQHGVNGFLWNTIEELMEYTNLVARDEQLLRQLSKAARERARFFSLEKTLTQFRDLIYR